MITFLEKVKEHSQNNKSVSVIYPLNALIEQKARQFVCNCSGCSSKCCNGSFFTNVQLMEEDQKRLGLVSLLQPCKFLKDDKCSIYLSRPKVCEAYPVFIGDKQLKVSVGCKEGLRFYNELSVLDKKYDGETVMTNIPFFTFNGLVYNYFIHKHNDTSANERCVEIALIGHLMYENKGKRILEVGNVLRNYFQLTHEVIDKSPEETGAIHQDILSYTTDSKFDLILAISTLEHVGITDGPNSDKINLVLDKFQSMLSPEGKIWASMPLGYNASITRNVKRGIKMFDEEYFLKRITLENDWIQVEREDAKNSIYGKPYPFGNALLIGVSGKK
jgi:Fe-S-cluster containining protein